MENNFEQKRGETVKNKEIVCYNCKRTIDASELTEGTFFKCQKCFATLIVADYFRVFRKNLFEKTNRWALIGLILGLFPMIFIVGFVTVYPFPIVSFYILISSLIVFSLGYYRKRASDILIGIIFCELGIYANVTRIIFIKYSKPEFLQHLPSLMFQIYFFLIIGFLLIVLGLYRRRKFVLK